MAQSNQSSGSLAVGENGDDRARQTCDDDDVTGVLGGLGRLAITDQGDVIPEPLVAPLFRPLPPADYTCVAFDLETTGLGTNAEITQLAATYGEKTFNRYVLPEGDITPDASRVTKLTKRDGHLYHDDEPVDTVDLTQCLTEFFAFLSGLEKPILLYGHNARRFDCPLLVTALTRTDLVSSFCRIVSGFSDTLRAFQSVLPGQKSYKQEDLVRTILNRTYGAHDALEDVRALQDLYRKVASDDVMRQHSFGVADVQQLCRNQVSNRNKMASLAGMIISGVISKYMAEKIASAGLSRDDLVSRYDVSGEEGVLQLLSAKVNGKPRVTKHEKTLRSIVAYLEENAKETKQ